MGAFACYSKWCFVGKRTMEKAATWISREYFMRADHGRPDIFELFHEDAEVYFP